MTRHRETVKAAALTAAALMTRPAVTIGPDEPVTRAARLMYSLVGQAAPGHRRGRDADTGIGSRADVLSVYGSSDADIRHEIIEDLILKTYLCNPSPTSRSPSTTASPPSKACRKGLRSAATSSKSGQHVEGVVAVRDRLSYPPAGHYTPNPLF